MGADEGRAFLEVGRRGAAFALEIQPRHVDDAVAHVDCRTNLQVFAGDLLEFEHLGVEFSRLVEILHDDGDVRRRAMMCYWISCCRLHNSSRAARATLRPPFA